MKRVLLILVVIVCLVSAGCSGPAATTVPDNVSQARESEFVLNESVRPGDDFYAYVNDAWIAEHPIPADKSRYTAIIALRDRVDDDLHALLIRAAENTSQSVDQNIAHLGLFYRSGMDTGTIDREGLLPLSDLLATIDAIDSRTNLTDATIVLLT